MAQAKTVPTPAPSSDQIEARGFVISEDADMALKDVATGLSALALLFDENPHSLPELNGADYAAIFRTFARQAQQVHDDSLFANQAMARPRDVH